jgi:hypothetical protein
VCCDAKDTVPTFSTNQTQTQCVTFAIAAILSQDDTDDPVQTSAQNFKRQTRSYRREGILSCFA